MNFRGRPGQARPVDARRIQVFEVATLATSLAVHLCFLPSSRWQNCWLIPTAITTGCHCAPQARVVAMARPPSNRACVAAGTVRRFWNSASEMERAGFVLVEGGRRDGQSDFPATRIGSDVRISLATNDHSRRNGASCLEFPQHRDPARRCGRLRTKHM